jgi:hypothetical protein
VLSAMTDNAKERMASKFNLTLDTLPVALYMIANGVGLKTVMRITNSDIIRKYTNKLAIKNAAIKKDDNNFKEENVFDFQIFKEMKEALTVGVAEDKMSDFNKSFDVKDLDKKSNDSDYRILTIFENVSKDAKIFQKVNSIMQLNKGFKYVL